jgi:membrane protein involved in colicin uptake
MKYVACFSMLIAMWCCAALSAESAGADIQRRSQELKERIEREEPRLRKNINAYVASIQNAVERHLVYPLGSGGKRCIASVTQDRSGNVVDLQLSQCESRRLASAVQAAMRAASPLPLPSDMKYFQRNLHLVFVVPDGR